MKIRPSKDKRQLMYQYGQLVGTEAGQTDQAPKPRRKPCPGFKPTQPDSPNQKAVPDDQFNATYGTWSELWRVAYD